MKRNYFFAGMMALAFLTGCNNDMYEGADIAGSPLNVLANINQVSTRLNENGTQWSANDEIGVSDVNGTYKNVRYTTDGSGNFTSSTGLYVLGDGETTYAAYYPFTGTDSEDAGTIDFNILEDENCDFMYAEATATRSNANATFTFTHQMTQIVMTLTDSSQPDQASGTRANIGDAITYTLKNVTVDGTFNTADGSVTIGTTKGDVTVETTLGSTSYVILPPTGAQETIEIQVNIDGKTYVGTINPSMVGNTSNSYTIDFSTAEPGIALTINSAGIGAWQDGNNGELGMDDLEEQAVPNTLEVGDFYLNTGEILDKNAQLTDEQKAQVVGVVFYVGNPQPSVLYAGTYAEDEDLLRTNFPNCTNGLVLSLAPEDGSHFCDADLTTVGLMNTWFMNQTDVKGIYSARYAWDEASSAVGASGSDSDAENNFLGYNNTYLWKTFAETKSVDILALSGLDEFATANPLPEGETSGWYIPSLGEMKTLVVSDGAETPTYSPVSAIAASFEKLGVTELFQESRYWTSTEGRISGGNAQTMSISFYSDGAYKNSISATTNGSTGWFHYAFAF